MVNSETVFPSEYRVDLFSGYPVTDYEIALTWYRKLLGTPPAFLPNDIEAVWELAVNRYIYIKFLPEHAGHASSLTFLSDLDEFISQVQTRGLRPAKQEILSNGVRRVIFNDPDGNEVGFGGAAQGE